MKAGGLDTTIDTPTSYDNLFFQNLLINNTEITTFASDKQLLTDPYALRMVRRLGRNQPYFFKLTHAVMNWMTTAGHDDLYYMNIWKYIEGPVCHPFGIHSPGLGSVTVGTAVNAGTPESDTAADATMDNANTNNTTTDAVSLASAASDVSKGSETDNTIDPDALVTKPQDQVIQQRLAEAFSSAYTPVNNEKPVTSEDLPKATVVELK